MIEQPPDPSKGSPSGRPSRRKSSSKRTDTRDRAPLFKFVYHRCCARSGHDTRARILRVCARPHREALIQAARSLGSDAAGIVAKSTEIEFIEARKGSFPSVYESLAAFCNARVSKAILGQEMTSEPGGRGLGSYALGRVHLEVRQDIVEADCKAPAKTITRQILRPLIGFNFGSDEPIPRACITRMIWNY